MLKKLVTGKSAASPARSGVAKEPAGKAPKVAAVAKAKPAKSSAPPSGKVVPGTKPTNGKTAPKGQVAAAPVPEVPLKKKPPSITITRPEATRPPVVIPPPRPLEAPVGAPSILVPKGGSPISSLTPILRWMYVGGATRYEVEWSHDAHFGRGHSTMVVSAQTMITLESPNDLKPNVNYKWRVRGGNDAGWGPWSPPESFKSPEK